MTSLSRRVPATGAEHPAIIPIHQGKDNKRVEKEKKKGLQKKKGGKVVAQTHPESNPPVGQTQKSNAGRKKQAMAINSAASGRGHAIDMPAKNASSGPAQKTLRKSPEPAATKETYRSVIHVSN
jgi:hypothetical protein